MTGKRKAAVSVFVVLGAVAVSFFAMSASPRARPLGPEAPLVEAGDSQVDAESIESYSARYTLRTKVMGVPIESRPVEVTVERVDDELHVEFGFPGLTDQMAFDGATLRPLRRGFPGQQFEFMGDRVVAQLGTEDTGLTERTFDFPWSVFEVSVLELVARGLALPTRLPWDDFQNPDDALAHIRQVETETVRGPDGADVDTMVLDIGFSDGTLRRYWLSADPPYKIRQHSYDRGRALVSSWELEGFELRSDY